MNSNQGSHFTCAAYIDLLKSTGSVKSSMNGKGRATDNAITERFFRNLKQEELYREDIAGPISDTEKIIYGELNLSDILLRKTLTDTAGRDTRCDVFNFN